MRTIKFRAWAKTRQEMVYLNPYEISGSARELNDLVSDEGWFVMQYTGLKDKNGVEIYEGDILADGAIVEWFNNLVWDGSGSLHSGFYCKKWAEDYTDGDPIDMSFHHGFDDENIEIAGNIYEGNIYEKSELIKGENNGL